MVASCGCAHVSLVPTQLRRLLSAGADIASFGTILLGGAGAPARLLDEARAAGGRVITTYGMTETCGGCVYDGMPLDGVRVAAGGDGRLRIAGPVLFSGYRLQSGAARRRSTTAGSPRPTWARSGRPGRSPSAAAPTT